MRNTTRGRKTLVATGTNDTPLRESAPTVRLSLFLEKDCFSLGITSHCSSVIHVSLSSLPSRWAHRPGGGSWLRIDDTVAAVVAPFIHTVYMIMSSLHVRLHD